MMEDIARAFEVAGVGVLVVGGVVAALWSFRLRVTGQPAYLAFRRWFGRVLLLGLEILVAADVIKTVAVDTTLENVLVLGVLVLVRTILSFSLEVEIDGMWPWRRRAMELEGGGLPPSEK